MAPAGPIHFGVGNLATQSISLVTRRYRPSPVHVYLWGPCPLSCRWLYLQDLINTALHLPMKIPVGNIRVTLFQLLHIYAGGATHFNHLKYSKMVRVGTRVAIFPMAVSDMLPGTLGVSLGRFFLHEETGSLSSTISGGSREQQSYLSPGGTREGWIPPGYSSVGPAIQIIWYVHSWQ